MSDDDVAAKTGAAPAPGDGAAAAPREELQPGDCYTEGPWLVFTEQYLLRRGFCCNSGCRHCPYR